MKFKNLLPAAASLLILSCNDKTKGVTTEAFKWPEGVAAPTTVKKPYKMVAHGDERIDNYYWMNDFFKKGPDSTKVVEYLTAENAYVDTMMSAAKQFRADLFKELKGRIKEKDESVPYKDNGYWYYTRFEEGKNYQMMFCQPSDLLSPGMRSLSTVPQQSFLHPGKLSCVIGML